MLDIGIFGFLPKRAQDVVAASLRKVIMAWIDECPDDFIKIHSQSGTISFQAEKIFDVIINTPDINNRKETLWPLAMALVLLCPETLSLAIHAILTDSRNKKEYSLSRISKKVVFLDNVRQCSRIDALCEISAICMTDFAKAIYLIPRDQQVDTLRYAAGNEKEMNALILDSTSRLYKNNRDRTRLSQLVLDKLIALYRADRKEFNEVVTNKAYHASSNTYITFNMARFCREYARRTQVKSTSEDFRELCSVVAPRIRRQLQSLLQTYVPTSPTSPDRSPPSKGATPVDKSELIVEILRYYVENIDYALIGTKLDENSLPDDDEKVYTETAILDYIMEESVGSRHPDISEAGADLVELIYSPQNAWRWTEYSKSNPDEGHFFWQYTYETLRRC
jgi:hypothetical protein